MIRAIAKHLFSTPRHWRNKLKFSCVTLKNKISACKVALWIACEQALHLGESRFTRHKWRACEQALLGRTIYNSAGLVSLVSSRWGSPFWELFALIRSNHTPHALLACLQLLPSSLVPLTLSLGKACRRGRRNVHHHARITALSRSSCVRSPWVSQRC